MNYQLINILLLEEDRAFAGLVARAFKSRPGKFTLTTVAGLAEAKEYIAQNSPDLAIADIILPDGMGTELIAISEEHGGFPVVLITGYGDAQEAVEAMKAGAIDCIVKSKETLDNLPQTMERTLRQWQHITERKRAEKALVDSENRFRSLAESANNAIISANSEGDIIFWNLAARKIFGFSSNEVMGKPLTLIMPQRYHESHLKAFAQAVSSKKMKMAGQTLELTGLNKDGKEFPLEASLATWTTAEGVFFTGILSDITQRKKNEEDAHRIQLEIAVFTERLKLLKDREREIMYLIADGKLNKQIALRVGLTRRTVETYRAKIMKKLQIASVAELVRYLTLLESQR